MIAFSCQGYRIHLFNPSDGTATSVEACDGELGRKRLLAPSWSNDGSQIAYTCWDQRFDSIVRKTNLDNGIETNYDAGGCWARYHSWAPGQSRIAIVELRDYVYDLCVDEPVLAQKREFTPP